ncbi:MAG: flagellar biosynthesis protein FliQ [Oxalobacteraceae bacterium]|jgi:flagellar biosynthetic protein FliQ|nr:flagellar biosynthesis protein FliQ [Oxalobacteraceae bacterium]
MEISTVVDLGRSALWAIVLISSPLLLVALGVGLFIGVIQAATSINESTLSFIPKLAAMGATLAIFGSWQLVMLVDYTKDIYKRIPALFS